MTTFFLAIGSILTAVIISGACYRLYKLNHLQTEKIASLQNQLSALCAGAVGTDERIIHFEQTLNQLKEHQNTISLDIPTQHSYDHAIRLARKGVDINQLIDNCNLSDEEAHLINRLHGSKDHAQELH